MALPGRPLNTGRGASDAEAAARALVGGARKGSFTAAIALIMAAKGRVIVSGMGKSGHVARKIAATFASTGTPAQFVHRPEASHGNLGILQIGRAHV